MRVRLTRSTLLSLCLGLSQVFMPALAAAARPNGPTAAPGTTTTISTAAVTAEAVSRIAHASASSNTDIVTNVSDSGPGSLRDTIANANPGDTITFAPNLGPIVLTSGELLISTTLTISGPTGGSQTISGGGQNRVFEVAPDAHVAFANLTITNGQAPTGNFVPYGNDPIGSGGGVLNRGDLAISNSNILDNVAGTGTGTNLNCAVGSGGGIANTGTLTITGSIVSGNHAGTGAPGCEGGSGGGIASLSGAMAIVSTTISNNNAGVGGSYPSNSNNSQNGGVGGNGGGVENYEGTLIISASAIISNTSGSGGSDVYGLSAEPGIGGGILNAAGSARFGASVTIRSSTIANNIGLQAGGGIANGGLITITASTVVGNASKGSGSGYDGYGGGVYIIYGDDGNPYPTLTAISNTILAGNTAPNYGPDCYGDLTGDYNLIQDTSRCWLDGTGTHDITGTAPLLGPLQDHGGPTYTMAPQPGSLAVDYIPAPLCGADADQHGYPRPDDNEAFCNIGAVESEVSPPASTPTSTGTPSPTPTDTPSPLPTATNTPPPSTATSTPSPTQVTYAGPTHKESGSGSENAVQTCSCDPVNDANGDFSHSFDDLTVPGRGVPLHVARTYNTLNAAQDGPLGFGWTEPYSMYLTADTTSTVSVHEEGGTSVTFAYSGTGYQAPSRVLATLVDNGDGTLTFMRDKDQIGYTFAVPTASTPGQLLDERDRNGYTTTLGYTDNQLTSITDPTGRALTLSYSGAHIVRIVDPIGRTVAYTYNAAGDLTDAQDVAGSVTHFTYYPGHLLQSMTDQRGGVTTNGYNAAGRVITQTDALSRTTTLAYAAGDNGAQTTTITDPNGNVTVEQYQNNVLVSQTKGYGTPQQATWAYTYDPTTLGIASATDPNGHTSYSTWDARGNLLKYPLKKSGGQVY